MPYPLGHADLISFGGIIGDRTRIARFKGARPNQLDHDAKYRAPHILPRLELGTVKAVVTVCPGLIRAPITSYLGYLLNRLYLVCVVLISPPTS